jgi:hypothetical protein
MKRCPLSLPRFPLGCVRYLIWTESGGSLLKMHRRPSLPLSHHSHLLFLLHHSIHINHERLPRRAFFPCLLFLLLIPSLTTCIMHPLCYVGFPEFNPVVGSPNLATGEVECAASSLAPLRVCLNYDPGSELKTFCHAGMILHYRR